MTKVNIQNFIDELKEPIYRIGDMFIFDEYEGIYILACVGYSKYNFISLSTGNRFTNEFELNDTTDIKMSDIQESTGDSIQGYTHINEVTIIVK